MKFSSWIYRIAHNETINWIKKNRKTLDLMDHDQDIQNGDSEMYERLEKEEGLKHIKKMLTKIKPKYKEVLILRYGDDKSYDEISNILRVPKSTVGTLIRRGTKELKIVNQKNEQKQTL